MPVYGFVKAKTKHKMTNTPDFKGRKSCNSCSNALATRKAVAKTTIRLVVGYIGLKKQEKGVISQGEKMLQEKSRPQIPLGKQMLLGNGFSVSSLTWASS